MSSSIAYYDQQSPSGRLDGTVPARAFVPLQPVDLATWNDRGWADPVFSQSHPDMIHRPWPYRFSNGQSVWICVSDGTWYRGRVVGQAKQGTTICGAGLFWCVEFQVVRIRARKWFAPLNGDIKPDDSNMLQLLSDGGWIGSDSERSDSGYDSDYEISS